MLLNVMVARLRKRPAAWVQRGNTRQHSRRRAVQALNEVAEQHGLRALPVKTTWRPFQRLIKSLQTRRLEESVVTRLRHIAKEWSDNGGRLDGILLPPETEPAEEDLCCAPPPLTYHKVLVPTFRLEAKAFMGTYNSVLFAASSWPPFLEFTKSFAASYGATAWAACLEQSLHVAGGAARYHMHNYFYWRDADGVRLRSTDPLVFEG